MAKITTYKNVLFTVIKNNGKIASVRDNLSGRFIKIQTYLKLVFSEFSLFDDVKKSVLCGINKLFDITFKKMLDSNKNGGDVNKELFSKCHKLGAIKSELKKLNQLDLAI